MPWKGGHYLALFRCALTNAQFTALHYNWSCCFERFYMGMMTWTETPLTNQMKVRKNILCTQHWIEKHQIDVCRRDWLIMVISQQYDNVLSVQLLPSTGSHFLALFRCAWTNAPFTALLLVLLLRKICKLTNQMKARNNTLSTQWLPSACEGLTRYFLSMLFNSVLLSCEISSQDSACIIG